MSGLVSAAEHEQATVRAFFLRDKQDRFLSFLANPKNRRKLTKELAHVRWFDPRFATPVSWKVDPTLKLWDRHVQGIENIVRLMRSRGAGQTCFVISEDDKLDRREIDLSAALETISGSGMGTILSCVPRKLAYFEGEDDRLLLAR